MKGGGDMKKIGIILLLFQLAMVTAAQSQPAVLPANIDVSVLMLFFNRPETFEKVFDAVRQARPSRLFLFQDGARNEKDVLRMEQCRKIAENIDWQCEVYRNYQEKNLGCMTAGFTSHRWAFSNTDKCIVIEDDVLPDQSFFKFCKEMLDRYENDTRITMVAGFNVDEETPYMPYSYFFTSAFSIWGWASWSRVVSQWDGEYSFLNDDFAVKQLTNLIKQRGYRKDFIKMCQDHREFWACMLFNSGMAVMPKKNLIKNIGASDDSTHFSSLKTMPRRMRRIMTMPVHQLEFPLVHPHYVIEEVGYWKRKYKANAWDSPLIKIGQSFEALFLNLRYGNFKFIWKSFKRRIRIWLGKEKFS